MVMRGRVLVPGVAAGDVLQADLALSFWGGVDPATGTIIDQHHPLAGASIEGRILAIPSGRGSCTGSSVMLQLLMNGKAPAGMVFSHDEDILTLGILLAAALGGPSIPAIRLSPEDFAALGAHAGPVEIRNGALVPVRADTTAAAVATDSDAPEAPFHLTARDEALLAGAEGEAAALAMRIIIAMARIAGADRLIDVSRAHIDGCIYTGPASLAFAEALVRMGGKVAVPTTLNAISVDHRRWRGQGVDPSFGEPAAALADAYVALGCQPSFTCAPYLLDDVPVAGEQIVWAESNAVVFANSVIGARTMKYPDFLDILIALTGRAPKAGCHLPDHRLATCHLVLDAPVAVDDSFWPLAGYLCGLKAPNAIPLISGLADLSPGRDALKAFGAAFATTSAAPMFHIEGVTPEAPDARAATGGKPLPVIRLGRDDFAAAWAELDQARDPVDLVSFGNPHFSLEECRQLAALVAGRTRHPQVTVMVTLGRDVADKAEAEGALATLRDFGIDILTDICWCMVEEPLIPAGARTIMTNSGKYAHYGPGLTGRRFRFGSLAQCVQAALQHRLGETLPDWLS